MDELDQDFIDKLQWSISHKPFVETHYRLICPNCYDGCHTLFVIGEYPKDYLGCRICCHNAEMGVSDSIGS